MVFTLRRVNNGNLIGPSLKAHYDRLEKFEGELRDVVTENPALKQNFRPDRDNVNDVQYNEQDHESTEIKIMWRRSVNIVGRGPTIKCPKSPKKNN